MLNVVQLWKSYKAKGGGGGGVVMYRLHNELRSKNINSVLLCEKEALDIPNLFNIKSGGKLDKLAEKFTGLFGFNDIHRISSFKLINHKAIKKSDVIHVHGTHHGFFNYLAFPKLTNFKPAVFTLHDMWPLTGHCAVSYDCNKWQSGCGNCPYLSSPPAVSRDTTRYEWKLKNWAFNNSNITFVCPSKQLFEQSKNSMVSNCAVEYIPHGIDTEVFKNHDKELCRKLLGINNDKFILMFGAVNLNNHHKGGDLLKEALKNLDSSIKENIHLVTIGDGGHEISSEVGIDITGLGYISDDRVKSIIYSSADVFISPTRAEAFGLVVLESMSCGTATVAYGVGGILDLVRHKDTGYVATPESSEDLRNGLMFLYNDRERLKKMQVKCRDVVETEYKIELHANRYIEVYKKLINV